MYVDKQYGNKKKIYNDVEKYNGRNVRSLFLDSQFINHRILIKII